MNDELINNLKSYFENRITKQEFLSSMEVVKGVIKGMQEDQLRAIDLLETELSTLLDKEESNAQLAENNFKKIINQQNKS
jgi:hypothetical protein